MSILDENIQFLKGVGPKRAEILRKKGIFKIKDLLYYPPFRYEDREFVKPISDLKVGEFSLIKAKILASGINVTRRKKIKVFEMVVGDGSGVLNVYFFNMPFLKRSLKEGMDLYIYGKVVRDYYSINKLCFQNPEFEVERESSSNIHRERIIPIYRSIGSLNSRQLREIIFNLLKNIDGKIDEFLPPSIMGKYSFPLREDALREIHFPDYREDFPFSRGEYIERLNSFSTDSHRRMIYEELFLFQLGLKFVAKKFKRKKKNRKIVVDLNLKRYLGKILPFKLTEAQKRVMREIVRDLESPYPMNRLLQGDVGSGKTIIALMSMLIVVKNGYQAVLMAPTEILAEQHFINFQNMLEERDVEIALLKSGIKKKEKEEIKKKLREGKVKILVGTHSVLEEDVEFDNLGLVVVDEQHRFGVIQRMKLYRKSLLPDIIVMTATPIPRTLALTLYGDLDLSIIDELPPNRKRVDTFLFFEDQMENVYRMVERELETGNRGYFVFPIIEDSEKVELKSLMSGVEEIKRRFSEYRVDVLHGKMGTLQKEDVMRRFKNGEIDILVATTVVEVGVDVGDANFMVIEHAERFGLAQLHQLRGRVGRGGREGKCLLVVHSVKNEDSLERLKVFVENSDGFKIAEEDMRIRGIGDLGGVKQWGVDGFKFANILRDKEMVEKVSVDVKNYLEKVGEITKIDERILEELKDFFGEKMKFFNWG